MKRILLVEDEPVQRMLLERCATDLGHQFVSCGNGIEALDKMASEDPFDLIVSDIIMPKMGGLDLIQFLRTKAETKPIPILAISAYVPLNDIYKVLEAGASRFLPKPLDLAHVREEMERLLRKPVDLVAAK